MALIIVIGAVIYSFKNQRPDQKKIIIPAQSVHYFKDPSLSLDKISLKIIYFIPKDRSASINQSWKELIEPAVKDLQSFHKIQFDNRSVINYEIFPDPVIGLLEAIDYDTQDTNRGNPYALSAITDELQNRFFDPAGDFYKGNFAKTESEDFSVIYIIYQGVGASGIQGSALLSLSYFINAEFSGYKESLFYHEFAHTLGMPDRFDEESHIYTSFDILGNGKIRPLANAYIDFETKKEMGF